MISTKNLIEEKKTKKQRTQTPKQCHNSTRLAHLQLLPIRARLSLVLLLAFEEGVGEGWGGVCRQRGLSASLPRTSLASTGAAGDWVQPRGRTQRSLDPGYPTKSRPRVSESVSDGSGRTARVIRQDRAWGGGKRRKGNGALEFLAVALPMEKESKILNIKL